MTRRTAFTLIELVVVIAILAGLIAVLVPSLTSARKQARSVKCLSQLRVLGQGLVMYSNENGDVFVPSRMSKVDACNWFADIAGGRKYRPTFLAKMSKSVGLPPFDDPKSRKTEIELHDQTGDRQDYTAPIYVCPAVPNWTDERNGSYGYNYQFLGNSRLSDSEDIHSFKNWPIVTTRIKAPAATVAVADCMGTAASFPPRERAEYDNNSRDDDRLGNEGFNLDPPSVDPGDGEMAGFEDQLRTAADPRHSKRANLLWVDTHADSQSVESLGDRSNPDGSIGFDGDNTLWSGVRRDVAWMPEITP